MAKEDIIVVHDFIGQEDIETFLTYEKYLDTNGLWDVGDTVGDPLKDTSGPAVNILIKLMSMTALVFGTFITEYGGQIGGGIRT